MKILGLDIGYTTGACLLTIENNQIVEVSSAEIEYPTKNEYFVYNTAREIEKFIKLAECDFVCIEEYAYGGSGFFNVRQAEIQGQVKRFVIDSDLPLFSGQQQNMRAAVIGKGNATKTEARRFVLNFLSAFKKEFKDSKEFHRYDAAVPAIYGYLFLARKLSAKNSDIVKETIIGYDLLKGDKP